MNDNLEYKETDIKIKEEEDKLNNYKKISFLGLLLYAGKRGIFYLKTTTATAIIITGIGVGVASHFFLSQKEEQIKITQKPPVISIAKDEKNKEFDQEKFKIVVVETLDGDIFKGTLIEDKKDSLIISISGVRKEIQKENIFKNSFR